LAALAATGSPAACDIGDDLSMNDVPVPRPAATVILVRDGDAGLETLLLRRNISVAFHGGAWVFPGGRLDPEDYLGAPVPDDPADEGHEPAARVGAVREAFEEAGLVVDPESLVPFSHWTTPAFPAKRYATWFFLAAAPAGPVTVDGSEITEHAWQFPMTALEARDAGEIDLSPPTYVSLLRLAQSSTVAEAIDEARSAPYIRFEPRIHPVDGGFVSVYPGDVAYDDQDRLDDVAPRHRLWAVHPTWRYERI
jgi:8-oxo-dGTP pyrophosphatase MutT (NUDIX family)